ncbi:SNF2-family ATP dependent chromatin remodeling factor snf21 [Phlyctochytrium arcticum]|nr:SNF2-family ATP dependent chromatin remodeling factor snf21 [Phlyctochytrium arcticum]
MYNPNGQGVYQQQQAGAVPPSIPQPGTAAASAYAQQRPAGVIPQSVAPSQLAGAQHVRHGSMTAGMAPALAIRAWQAGQPLSQEQLKGVISMAQAMKEKGATEASDPEFAQMLQILRNYSSWGKSLASQQGDLTGVNGPPRPPQPPRPLNQSGSNAGGQTPATGDAVTASGPAGAGNAAASTPVGPFTPEQLTALRCQIYVFKLISGNKPVPEQLRQRVFDVSTFNGSESPTDVTEDPVAQIPREIAEAAYNQPPKQTDGVMPVIRATTARFEQGPLSNPYALLPKKISVADLQQRVIIPSGTPGGLDIFTLLAEREKQIQARINYRIQELESLPSNLNNDSGVKLKALIELKSLRLLEKQKKLRSEIVQSVSKSTTLATATDRNSFRRMKKQSLREAKQTEKLEKNQRLEREKREKQKHVDYLLSILQHGREMISFHRQQQSKAIRLGQAVSRFHVAAQKEEEKRQSRISQERLNALKANDEAAYLKLVDKAKDNRIMHLLNQTETFLGSLTKAMQDQKASVVDEIPNHDRTAEGIDDEDKDYYNTAHRITEIVTEQPSIMIGGRLKDYQLKGLQWMVSLYNNKLNGILADEMGLGKTIQSISLVTYLMEKKRLNGPFLVIVPLSTITNWDLEFERWAPTCNRIVFKGTVPERLRMKNEIKAGNFNVVITTYEYIIREKALLAKIKWVYMIIDEGHRMKNTSSKLSMTLGQYYSTRYRIILTGTPLQNNLPELWALLNFILPKIFNSVETFDEWFNHPFAKEGVKDTDMKLNEEESLLIIRGLHKVLRPFLLRRLKKDVESELPDKIEKVIKCPMSALQLRLYEQIRSKRTSFGVDGVTRRKALNNLVMQFRKVCNHPYVFEEVEQTMNPHRVTDDNLWRVAGKFELLDRILPKYKATGHRVLMFFQMTQVMDIMEDYLRMRQHSYLRLDGHTKAEDRTTMLKIFNSKENPPFIFLLSTRAGGLGLNLQTADTVVIFDSDWNPHQDLQAQDRAHRIGQTKKVQVLRLITARSVEETILARAQYKLDIDGKVIQAGKFDNKTTESERDELLRKLFGSDEDDVNQEDDEGHLEDADLNEIINRSDEELQIFNQMDAERKALEQQMWRASGRKGNPPPRLIQDNELPASYLEADNPVMDEIELDLGRGARVRKDVRYDDGLNDDQFLAALDTGDLEGYIHKRAAQRARREERKKGRGQDDEEEDEDDEEPTQERDFNRVADEGKVPKRRGRPPKKPKVQEDFDEEMDDGNGDDLLPRKRNRTQRTDNQDTTSTPATVKRKKKKVFAGVDTDEVDTIPPVRRHALRRVMLALYKLIEDAEVVYDNGMSRSRSELFRQVPPKALYPDYYKLIRTPIALDMIHHRANYAYYKNLQHFLQDMHLMFSNAMQYNVDGSEVYEDAAAMKQMLDEEAERLAPGGNIIILPQDEVGQEAEDPIGNDGAQKRKRSIGSPEATEDEDIGLGGGRSKVRRREDEYDSSATPTKPRKKNKRDSGVPGMPSKYGQLPKIKMRIPARHPDGGEEYEGGSGFGGSLEDGEIME